MGRSEIGFGISSELTDHVKLKFCFNIRIFFNGTKIRDLKNYFLFFNQFVDELKNHNYILKYIGSF